MALTYKEADEFIAAFLAMRDGADDALASVSVDVYPELNEDFYKDLDMLCQDLNVDKEVLIEKLADIDYEYDVNTNQFV